MADFSIRSLRAGQNDFDPPTTLADDACVLARNVEFYNSMLGERRKGAAAISLDAGITAKARVTFLHRHLPSSLESEAQLWVLGASDAGSYVLQYKDTAWHSVTPVDAFSTGSDYQYNVAAQSLHGKLFIAYKSAEDRLHVWDGTSLRRTGLAEPAAPTAANPGSGSLTGARYYRVRYTVQDGSGVTLRRSEPGDVLTFTPSGSGSAVRVTKPATINEDETHWELEASIDNANFYVIAASAVATTTVDDDQDYVTGYAQDFVLSEDTGDYSLIPSGRFLLADEDRLIMAGSFEDDALASRVTWTPVYNDPGDGNDERIPTDTDNFLDLDGFEGGPITGMGGPVSGSIWVFKLNHTYKLVRTGIRSRAYDSICVSKTRGALKGSIVQGIDQTGRPCLYFLDPNVGPCRTGATGLERCGADIYSTWQTVNLDATKVVCRSVYDPVMQQVHWWVATGASNTPTLRLVLQVNEVRSGDDGARRGWATWDGPSAQALAVCLFSDNIDDDTARNNTLRPFIGIEGSGHVWQTDTGSDDNGTEYSAHIVSKPYAAAGILNQFGVMAGALLAKAVADATIDITVTPDFGAQNEVPVTDVSLAPTGSETQVIKKLDNLSISECSVVQVEFEDTDSPGARWELNQFSMKLTKGQTS